MLTYCVENNIITIPYFLEFQNKDYILLHINHLIPFFYGKKFKLFFSYSVQSFSFSKCIYYTITLSSNTMLLHLNISKHKHLNQLK